MAQKFSIHAARALDSLSSAEKDWIRQLPKAELHAHLNGSIPISVLQDLAKDYTSNDQLIHTDIERIRNGVQFTELQDFFGLFPTIYALTAKPDALTLTTRGVLNEFLEFRADSGSEVKYPHVTYIELRSTPKENAYMTRAEYVDIVLKAVEEYPPERAALIVSLDRTMSQEVAEECIDVAIKMKQDGRRVVGVDLCGNPTAGEMDKFAKHFDRAREAGLKITLHIAETTMNTPDDTSTLLSFKPDRLGHATFLNERAQDIVVRDRIPIELCLSSNLLCKTVCTLDTHHILYYLEKDHPISICTDDILPFRTNMLGEYALLLAKSPDYGLGLSQDQVKRIAEMGFESKF